MKKLCKNSVKSVKKNFILTPVEKDNFVLKNALILVKDGKGVSLFIIVAMFTSILPITQTEIKEIMLESTAS